MSRFLLTAFIALGPLQWITLLSAGLDLKPVHIPYFLAAGLGFVQLVQGRDTRISNTAVAFFVFYSVYVLAMMLSLIQGGQLVYTLKIMIYFLATAGFFLMLLQMPREEIIESLFRGGLLATVGFFLVAWITLAGRGINMFETIFTAITTGNPALLQFKIFLNLFNEDLADLTADNRISSSLRHTVMGFVFIALMTGLHCLIEHKRQLAWITVGLALCILLISLSRSQILTSALAMMPLAFVQFVRSGKFFFAVMAGMVGLAVFFMSSNVAEGIALIIENRFGSFGDDGRVGMYEVALNEIDERPLLGHGAGVQVFYGGRASVPVHNLFLASWHQAGVLGLFSALGFTVVLAIFYGAHLVRYVMQPGILALAGLLVLPLFRSQVAGGGGNYALPEWACIAISIAVLSQLHSTRRVGAPALLPGPPSGITATAHVA